jgi:hypothetical protein
MHLTPNTNQVFYVGIGQERRPFKFHGRNRYWTEIVNKHGTPNVVIIAQNVTYEKQKKLLSEMFKGENNPIYDKTIYLFVNLLGETVSCTQHEMLQKFDNLTRDGINKIVRGKTKSHRGWKVIK